MRRRNLDSRPSVPVVSSVIHAGTTIASMPCERLSRVRALTTADMAMKMASEPPAFITACRCRGGKGEREGGKERGWVKKTVVRREDGRKESGRESRVGRKEDGQERGWVRRMVSRKEARGWVGKRLGGEEGGHEQRWQERG